MNKLDIQTFHTEDTSIRQEENLALEPLIQYARALRRNQTKAEKFMWKLLRDRRFHGFKFRRQHPVSDLYILDFYCEAKKLAIELDGVHHNEKLQKEYDEERTYVLKLLGIRLIRFENEKLFSETEDVILKIFSELNS